MSAVKRGGVRGSSVRVGPGLKNERGKVRGGVAIVGRSGEGERGMFSVQLFSIFLCLGALCTF